MDPRRCCKWFDSPLEKKGPLDPPRALLERKKRKALVTITVSNQRRGAAGKGNEYSHIQILSRSITKIGSRTDDCLALSIPHSVRGP